MEQLVPGLMHREKGCREPVKPRHVPYSFFFLNPLTITGIKAKTPKRKKAIKTLEEKNSPGELIRPS